MSQSNIAAVLSSPSLFFNLMRPAIEKMDYIIITESPRINNAASRNAAEPVPMQWSPEPIPMQWSPEPIPMQWSPEPIPMDIEIDENGAWIDPDL